MKLGEISLKSFIDSCPIFNSKKHSRFPNCNCKFIELCKVISDDEVGYYDDILNKDIGKNE